MIRVLQVIDNMDIGGMETMLMNYYRSIDRKKVQYDFLITDRGKCAYEEEIKSLGGKIYKVTPRRKNPLKNRHEMVEFFSNHRYEVIEIHQGVTYLLPLKLANRKGIKNIIIHNHGVNSKYKKGLLNLFRKAVVIPLIERSATSFFACSESVLHDLFSDNIINNKKYTIINNAINASSFKYNKNKRMVVRKKLNLNNELAIGHVGNFTYPKNQAFVLKIAAKMPNVKFILVGDGEYCNECKRQSSNNVVFLGARNDVNELMQAFDLFILPSRWEGLPLVAIEAQAAGLPVLLSDTVSREAAVLDNVQFIPLDVELWVKTINESIPHSRHDAYEAIKDSGYDCQTEADKLMDIYIEMKSRKEK